MSWVTIHIHPLCSDISTVNAVEFLGFCCCELSAMFLVFKAINVSVLALLATSLTCQGTSQNKEHAIAVLGNVFIDCKWKSIFCFYK